jgi:hypothetical protein
MTWVLGILFIIAAWKWMMARHYRRALTRIAALNYEKDATEGNMNEWAEAECFWTAKAIARRALFHPE